MSYHDWNSVHSTARLGRLDKALRLMGRLPVADQARMCAGLMVSRAGDLMARAITGENRPATSHWSSLALAQCKDELNEACQKAWEATHPEERELLKTQKLKNPNARAHALSSWEYAGALKGGRELTRALATEERLQAHAKACEPGFELPDPAKARAGFALAHEEGRLRDRLRGAGFGKSAFINDPAWRAYAKRAAKAPDCLEHGLIGTLHTAIFCADGDSARDALLCGADIRGVMPVLGVANAYASAEQGEGRTILDHFCEQGAPLNRPAQQFLHQRALRICLTLGAADLETDRALSARLLGTVMAGAWFDGAQELLDAGAPGALLWEPQKKQASLMEAFEQRVRKAKNSAHSERALLWLTARQAEWLGQAVDAARPSLAPSAPAPRL